MKLVPRTLGFHSWQILNSIEHVWDMSGNWQYSLEAHPTWMTLAWYIYPTTLALHRLHATSWSCHYWSENSYTLLNRYLDFTFFFFPLVFQFMKFKLFKNNKVFNFLHSTIFVVSGIKADSWSGPGEHRDVVGSDANEDGMEACCPVWAIRWD